MRNRISCSAQQLAQLEPDMVQSVVGEEVFNLGTQYFNENRVRIQEATSAQFSAEVNGTYGVYALTIRLRAGTLSTKCSCPSTEQPFCRHCVAALLQYYRDYTLQKDSEVRGAEADQAETFGNGNAASTSADVNFREVTMFVDWVQSAVEALGTQGPLPPPSLLHGKVRDWARAIDGLHQRYVQSEEDRSECEAELRAAEERMKKLTEDLEQSRLETRHALGTNAGLQQQTDRYNEILAELSSKVTQDRDRLIEQVSRVKDDLQQKCVEIEDLASGIKRISHAFDGVHPSSFSS